VWVHSPWILWMLSENSVRYLILPKQKSEIDRCAASTSWLALRSGAHQHPTQHALHE
jgi:hypothetical protein